jgi:hypothetical protein
LEQEVCPPMDPALLAKPLTKVEIEEILGYGPEGV